jgi:hypothetical protein
MSQPLREQLVRATWGPSWEFAGALDEGKAILEAECTELRYWTEKGVHYISARNKQRFASTTADSEEDAWRTQIGCHLGNNQPHPDDAKPGETLSDFKDRLTRTQ